MRYKGPNLGGVCFPRTPSFLGFPPRSPPHPRFARVRRLATLSAHPIAALTTPLSSMASLAHPNALNAFSNVLNSPLNSASLPSETHKPRALSTCMVCFQKGHRRAPFPSLISFLDADKYSVISGNALICLAHQHRNKNTLLSV